MKNRLLLLALLLFSTTFSTITATAQVASPDAPAATSQYMVVILTYQAGRAVVDSLMPNGEQQRQEADFSGISLKNPGPRMLTAQQLVIRVLNQHYANGWRLVSVEKEPESIHTIYHLETR